MTQEATSEVVWYVIHKFLIDGDTFHPQHVYSRLRQELADDDITIDPALVVRTLHEMEARGKLADYGYAGLQVVTPPGEYEQRYNFRMYFPFASCNVQANKEAHQHAAVEWLTSNSNSTAAVLFHEGFLGVTTVKHPIGKRIRTFTDPHGEGSFDLLLMAPSKNAETRREYVHTHMLNWSGVWFPNTPFTSADIDALLRLPFPVPLALNITRKLAGRIHDRLLWNDRGDHLLYGEGEWKRLSRYLRMFDWERSRWDDE